MAFFHVTRVVSLLVTQEAGVLYSKVKQRDKKEMGPKGLMETSLAHAFALMSEVAQEWTFGASLPSDVWGVTSRCAGDVFPFNTTQTATEMNDTMRRLCPGRPHYRRRELGCLCEDQVTPWSLPLLPSGSELRKADHSYCARVLGFSS